MTSPHVSAKVWGDLACFSRPEFKVERVSYSVMTPSAARGVLEAVYWKPEFRYRVRQIDVVEPGVSVSLLRNEITDRQGTSPLVVEDRRTQRSALMLQAAAPERPITYVVHADLERRPHAREPLATYVSQLERRLRNGQCFHRPYLGTRECAAFFSGPSGDEPDASFSLHVGTMLLDLAFVPSEARRDLSFRRAGAEGDGVVGGYAHPVYFDAHVERGVLAIDPAHYDRLDALEAA